jgi:hypothetical protein
LTNDNQDPEAFEPQVPLPEMLEEPEPTERRDDDEPVQVSIFVTRADRVRLRSLGIDLHLSLQRMGHRAWNSYLASQGQPELTAVFPGRQGKKSKQGA